MNGGVYFESALFVIVCLVLICNGVKGPAIWLSYSNFMLNQVVGRLIVLVLWGLVSKAIVE